jgi:hypothetical protein
MTHPSLRALAVLGSICAAVPAFADTSFLSGSYTTSIETICPASQTVDSKGKGLTLTPTSPGEISHSAGILNFFSGSGRTGTFKSSDGQTDGSAIVSTVNKQVTGLPFSLTDSQNFGNYSMTDDTLTLTFDKQQPQTFEAVYGGVGATGVVQKANLLMVSADTSPCATQILMRLQQPGGR